MIVKTNTKNGLEIYRWLETALDEHIIHEFPFRLTLDQYHFKNNTDALLFRLTWG
jgi:hypothetical protein